LAATSNSCQKQAASRVKNARHSAAAAHMRQSGLTVHQPAGEVASRQRACRHRHTQGDNRENLFSARPEQPPDDDRQLRSGAHADPGRKAGQAGTQDKVRQNDHQINPRTRPGRRIRHHARVVAGDLHHRQRQCRQKHPHSPTTSVPT
jgi:hypothetical protein